MYVNRSGQNLVCMQCDQKMSLKASCYDAALKCDLWVLEDRRGIYCVLRTTAFSVNPFLLTLHIFTQLNRSGVLEKETKKPTGGGREG